MNKFYLVLFLAIAAISYFIYQNKTQLLPQAQTYIGGFTATVPGIIGCFQQNPVEAIGQVTPYLGGIAVVGGLLYKKLQAAKTQVAQATQANTNLQAQIGDLSSVTQKIMIEKDTVQNQLALAQQNVLKQAETYKAELANLTGTIKGKELELTDALTKNDALANQVAVANRVNKDLKEISSKMKVVVP